MSRIGVVYKLCCDNVDGFYIGSTFNIKKRKRDHKTNCNNPKSNKYNFKVYQYIRDNRGFDNWKFEILVEKEFENKPALLIKEKECCNLLKPTLNIQNPYRTNEEMKLQKQAVSAKQKTSKINCICGGKTDKSNKASHEKTNKHKKYITNNINNITYNITNLNINN